MHWIKRKTTFYPENSMVPMVLVNNNQILYGFVGAYYSIDLYSQYMDSCSPT